MSRPTTFARRLRDWTGAISGVIGLGKQIGSAIKGSFSRPSSAYTRNYLSEATGGRYGSMKRYSYGRRKAYRRKGWKRARRTYKFPSYYAPAPRTLRTGLTRAAFVEKKYADNFVGGINGADVKFQRATMYITPQGTYNLISGVKQGNGESERLGTKYCIKSVTIKGSVQRAALSNKNVSDIVDTWVDIYLVLDKQTNGNVNTASFGSDVFDDAGNSTALAHSMLRNREFTHRFQVLKRIRVYLPANAYQNGTGSGNAPAIIRNWKLIVPKCNIPVRTNGTTGNYSDCVDNSLHLLAIQTRDPNDIVVRLYMNSRIEFYDGAM